MKGEEHYRILYDIARELNSSLAPEEVLHSIVEWITRAAGAKGCSLMLLTPEREQLIHTVGCGLSDWYIRKGPVRADAVISEVLQGKPVTILNAAEDPRVQYKEAARREGIASMLSIPIMLRGEVTGIIRIYTSEPRQFSPEDIDFLSALSNLGAIALEKAELHASLGEELAELEKQRDRLLHFLSAAAHDLKAPLAAIQSYLEVMLGGFAGDLNEKQRNMIARSSQRIVGLLNLISDLLDISQIETSQIVEEMEEVSLPRIIESSLEDLRSSAEQRGVAIHVEMSNALTRINASGARLQQVVTNLINNAINYTAEGSVTIRVREEGEDICVDVIDTGIGIPPQDLPRVFDDFFRASNVESKGTGLGLSIAKRIVEAHGGKIRVESPCHETKRGSKFTFTLPKRN